MRDNIDYIALAEIQNLKKLLKETETHLNTLLDDNEGAVGSADDGQ